MYHSSTVPKRKSQLSKQTSQLKASEIRRIGQYINRRIQLASQVRDIESLASIALKYRTSERLLWDVLHRQ